MENSDLLAELVSLRHLQMERDNMLKTNHKYTVHLAQLQIKASQLNLEIKTKDRELNRIKHFSSSFVPETSSTQQELETKLKILRLENEYLKKMKGVH